jgi:nucleoside-diphosphate-sugar epimerase
MRVLLTGATGFLGGRILGALRARQLAVRALVRPGRGPAPPGEGDAELVSGDLERLHECAGACDGVEAAIHAAAVAPDWGPYGDLRARSARIQKDLVAALVRARVRRLVLVSAVSVYGPAMREAREITEDEPPALSGELCGDTKVDAEAIAWEAHRLGLIEVVVVRPCTCYGPGDRAFLPRLVGDLVAGRGALVGGGTVPALLCHADHVAEVCALAATCDRAAGHAFHVRDADLLPWRDVIGRVARAAGASPPTRSVPAGVARAGARALEAIGRLIGSPHPPVLTRHAVDILTACARLSLARAREILGWQPSCGTAAGLAEVLCALEAGRTTTGHDHRERRADERRR